jgi:hypothetical protein
MLHALDRYRRVVLAEHGTRALALSVLDKRASSSAWSLLQSVDRRLAWLGDAVGNERQQLPLPFTPADGEHDADDEPPAWPVGLALSDVEEERRLLQAISVAARAASAGAESKLRALGRFLRRTHEAAIVFTEYRDTAEHVCDFLEREGFNRALHRRSTLLLHGGLSSDERSALVDRFSRSPAAVLVATDAAGQGLNLHRACRLVVNLELPWNPMRLEQRIGRVDRIGQSQTVHAIHLVAAGTREERMLARLRGRLAAARDAIDAPDPLSTSSARHRDQSQARSQSTAGATEAARLAVARSLSTAADTELVGELESSRWWVARARGRRLRARLSGRALFIYRLSAENPATRTIASRIVPIVADSEAAPDTLASLVVEPIARRWETRVVLANNRFWQQRIARERSMVAAAPVGAVGLFQPALFDRRAERLQRERHAEAERSAEHLEARLAHAVLQSGLERRSCELLLVLLP